MSLQVLEHFSGNVFMVICRRDASVDECPIPSGTCINDSRRYGFEWLCGLQQHKFIFYTEVGFIDQKIGLKLLHVRHECNLWLRLFRVWMGTDPRFVDVSICWSFMTTCGSPMCLNRAVFHQQQSVAVKGRED